MQGIEYACVQKVLCTSKSPGISLFQGIYASIVTIYTYPDTFFFHPDYTVGFGVSPNHALRLVGYTTGRESHPALKIIFNYLSLTILLFAAHVNC